MPVNIYQIGNLPLHLHTLHPFEGKFSATGKPTSLFWSNRVYYPSKRYISGGSRDISMTGLLLNQCNLTAEMTLARLQSMVDMELDIIGYLDLGCCSNSTCCACSGGSGCRLLWLETRGFLDSVDPKQRDNADVVEVSIGFKHSGYWSPIHRYFWNFGGGGGFANPLAMEAWTPYRDYMMAVPHCDEIFCDSCPCESFHKRNFEDCLLGYDPELWVAIACELPPFYPPVNYSTSWTTDQPKQYLTIDADLWSAPPMSVYAFRNLPDTGTIQIDVNRPEGLWGGKAETTTLDLAALNDALDDGGYTGLLTTDIVYLGNVEKMPGFVVRGGEMIDNPRPLPDYVGRWPGYLAPGYNTVKLTVPEGVEFAYIHEMRRL